MVNKLRSSTTRRRLRLKPGHGKSRKSNINNLTSKLGGVDLVDRGAKRNRYDGDVVPVDDVDDEPYFKRREVSFGNDVNFVATPAVAIEDTQNIDDDEPFNPVPYDNKMEFEREPFKSISDTEQTFEPPVSTEQTFEPREDTSREMNIDAPIITEDKTVTVEKVVLESLFLTPTERQNMNLDDCCVNTTSDFVMFDIITDGLIELLENKNDDGFPIDDKDINDFFKVFISKPAKVGGSYKLGGAVGGDDDDDMVGVNDEDEPPAVDEEVATPPEPADETPQQHLTELVAARRIMLAWRGRERTVIDTNVHTMEEGEDDLHHPTRVNSDTEMRSRKEDIKKLLSKAKQATMTCQKMCVQTATFHIFQLTNLLKNVVYPEHTTENKLRLKIETLLPEIQELVERSKTLERDDVLFDLVMDKIKIKFEDIETLLRDLVAKREEGKPIQIERRNKIIEGVNKLNEVKERYVAAMTPPDLEEVPEIEKAAKKRRMAPVPERGMIIAILKGYREVVKQMSKDIVSFGVFLIKSGLYLTWDSLRMFPRQTIPLMLSAGVAYQFKDEIYKTIGKFAATYLATVNIPGLVSLAYSSLNTQTAAERVAALNHETARLNREAASINRESSTNSRAAAADNRGAADINADAATTNADTATINAATANVQGNQANQNRFVGLLTSTTNFAMRVGGLIMAHQGFRRDYFIQ